jgi:hypothetical protein
MLDIRRNMKVQGVAAGDAIVDNAMFYDLSGGAVRKTFVRDRAWSGPGSLDTVNIPKVGLLGDLFVTVTTDVTFGAAPNGLPTWRWPYDLCAFNLAANGVTNLIDVPGSFLKVREIMGDVGAIDRGISRLVGGAAITNGHLASSLQDRWVFGPGAAYTTAGTTQIQITYRVPVLLEETHGTGLIYAQTSATNIALNLRWASIVESFKSDGTQPTFANTRYTVSGDVYSIPTYSTERDGLVEVIPELSTLHMFRYVQFPLVASGNDQEFELPNIGPGKQLLRLVGRVMNGVTLGAGPTATPVNPEQLGLVGAYYGTNDLIREYTGVEIASSNERAYGCAINAGFGFFAVDMMDKNNAIRDTKDEANLAGARLRVSIPTTITVTQPARIELAIEEAVTAGA